MAKKIISSNAAIGKKNLASWKKGTSGNPAGKPPGTRNRKTVIQEWLECKATDGLPGTMQDQLIRVMVMKGMKGDLASIKELLDGFHGKVSDVHEFSGIADAPPIKTETVVAASPEAAALLYQQMIKGT